MHRSELDSSNHCHCRHIRQQVCFSERDGFASHAIVFSVSSRYRVGCLALSTLVHPLLSGYIAIRDGNAAKAFLFRSLNFWTIRTKPFEWTLATLFGHQTNDTFFRVIRIRTHRRYFSVFPFRIVYCYADSHPIQRKWNNIGSHTFSAIAALFWYKYFLPLRPNNQRRCQNYGLSILWLSNASFYCGLLNDIQS